MKNKKTCNIIYRILILSFILTGMLVLTGCGKKEEAVSAAASKETKAYQVVTDLEEKYVCAMYRLQPDEIGSVVANMQKVDDQNTVYTAEYMEDLISFGFLVKENGLYKVSIVRGDEVLSEHMVDINEENDYYLLYMRGMR